MKDALFYLVVTRFKNKLLEILRNPKKLIYAIIMIALMVMVIVMPTSRENGESPRDMRELGAGVAVVCTLIFYLLIKNGFGRGGGIFTMPDVNLVFTAPIKNRSVLFYGLVQQMGTSLLLGLFIIYQYAWMHNVYGITPIQLIAILLCYSATVFVGQLCAMTIYAMTSSDDKLRRKIQIVIYSLLALYAAYGIITLLSNPSSPLTGLGTWGGSIYAYLFPVSGWLAGAVFGVLASSVYAVIAGVGATVIFIVGALAVFSTAQSDYYEDVISTAENMQNAILAKKEGMIGEAVPRNIKLGKTGIGSGEGAEAFYYKHKLENRRGRVFILDSVTLIFAVVTIIFAVIMKEQGIIAVFSFSTYMQIFSAFSGRFQKELSKPYIYLVPEPPFKKLLCAIRDSLLGAVVEAVVVYIPVSVILGLSPVEALSCIVARISFSFIFIACSILASRVFGSGTGAVGMMMFKIFMMLAIAAPGIILAIVLSSLSVVIVSATVTSFAAISLINFPIALGVMFLCRDMLQYAEING